jgi:hypothetical protein
MSKLFVPYATWKTLVQAGNLSTYYKASDGTDRNVVWAGTVEYLVESFVGGADFTDWSSVFSGEATLVEGVDEATAKVIAAALGDRFGENRSSDGTLTTAPQKLILGQAPFLRTDDGTAQINVNGTTAGTPLVVWNGTGGSDTGGDWTPSGQGSETSGSMHAGTNGWDTGVTGLGNLTKFDGGADQDIAGSYDDLSFWMQPKVYPAGSNLRIRWKTNGGGNGGGAELDISGYVTDFDLDVWQKVSIPIADFGLTGDVDKIQFKFGSQGGQHFWFDDIELNTSAGGGPHIFRVAAPDTLQTYHLTMAVLVLSAPGAGWDPTSFADVAGGLVNGLLMRQRKISTGEVLWSLNNKDNVDLFGRFHPQDDITFDDGTLLVGFMIKPGTASVVVTDDSVLEIVVRDNLSTLTSARAFAHYGVEVIS